MTSQTRLHPRIHVHDETVGVRDVESRGTRDSGPEFPDWVGMHLGPQKDPDTEGRTGYEVLGRELGTVEGFRRTKGQSLTHPRE